MPNSPRPYISSCPLCEQGLVGIASCPDCAKLVAICDECEAIWRDPRAFVADTSRKPDAQHPECPHCRHEIKDKNWRFWSAEKLRANGLGELIAGESG